MDRAQAVLARVKTKATTTDPVFGCCSLQKATLAVAIIDIVLGGIFVIYTIVYGFIVTGTDTKAKEDDTKPKEAEGGNKTEEGKAQTDNKDEGNSTIVTIIYIILIATYVAILGLSILLYIGAKKRDYSKVRLWFVVNMVCAVIVVLHSFAGLTSFVGFIRVLLSLLIPTYELWIVYAFMHEIDPEILAGRLEGSGGDFQGIGVSTNHDEVQFSKNPYESQQQQQQSTYGQPDPYGWDN